MDTRSVWTQRDGLFAADWPVLLEGDRHRALIVCHRCSIGVVEIQRSAPEVLPQLRSPAPQFHGRLVVLRYAPGGISRIHGYPQGLNQADFVLWLQRIESGRRQQFQGGVERATVRRS